MPKTDTSGNSKKGQFTRSQFKYDSNRDLYVSPANQELPKSSEVGVKSWNKTSNTAY